MGSLTMALKVDKFSLLDSATSVVSALLR